MSSWWIPSVQPIRRGPPLCGQLWRGPSPAHRAQRNPCHVHKPPFPQSPEPPQNAFVASVQTPSNTELPSCWGQHRAPVEILARPLRIAGNTANSTLLQVGEPVTVDPDQGHDSSLPRLRRAVRAPVSTTVHRHSTQTPQPNSVRARAGYAARLRQSRSRAPDLPRQALHGTPPWSHPARAPGAMRRRPSVTILLDQQRLRWPGSSNTRPCHGTRGRSLDRARLPAQSMVEPWPDPPTKLFASGRDLPDPPHKPREW